MEVTVVKATLNDEPTFRNLFQFYLYEFSRFMGWHVTYSGRYFEIDLDGCWTDDTRQPFLIRADQQLAGLAIVDRRAQSELSGSADVRELSEFFVMAAVRRRGVGMRAAVSLFDRYPGRWEVRQLVRNADALPFWRQVIGRYTSGRYTEMTFDDERWRGTAQFFDNTGFARSNE